MPLFERLKKSAQKSSEESRRKKVEGRFYQRQRARRMADKKSVVVREVGTGEYYPSNYRKLSFKEKAEAFKGRYGSTAKRVAQSPVFENIAQGRRQQLTYARGIRRPLIGAGRGSKTGKRGRPTGSYDTRYARYGGVYGYRKVLSAQLQQQKLSAMRNATISPQQQTILSQMEAQARARRVNPENQIIPDTNGVVRTKTIHDEIWEASHLVD